jgi:hypothetical protein
MMMTRPRNVRPWARVLRGATWVRSSWGGVRRGFGHAVPGDAGAHGRSARMPMRCNTYQELCRRAAAF